MVIHMLFVLFFHGQFKPYDQLYIVQTAILTHCKHSPQIVLAFAWDAYYTLFFYKNHAYKNVEAQITPNIKNIVVILLVAISISFPASDEI